MTALDSDIFDPEARPSHLRAILSQWPAFTCLALSILFMLATDNPDATSRWQETSREEVVKLSMNLESGRSMRQVAFVLMGLWGAISIMWPARRYRVAYSLLYPMGIFVFWAMASVLWSDDRSFTVKRLFVFACLAMAVFGFVRRHRVRDLALLALIGCSIQMLASIAADLLWATGSYGKSGYRFSGLQHPNHSGINAVFLCFACLYFFDRTRLRRFLVIFFIAACVLFLTKSRSALIAGTCGMAMFAALRWPLRRVLLVGLALSAIVGGFLALDAAGFVPEGWSDLVYMGREDASQTALTGRPEIWHAALELFGDDPVRYLTGVGYQSFWTPERADYVTNRLLFHISEGHNAFFDLMLELGYVGSVCYACVLLISQVRWSVAAARHDNPAYALGAAIMTFVVVHSMTESTTIDPNFSTFFSYATMAFMALHAPRWSPRPREEAGPVPSIEVY